MCFTFSFWLSSPPVEVSGKADLNKSQGWNVQQEKRMQQQSVCQKAESSVLGLMTDVCVGSMS